MTGGVGDSVEEEEFKKLETPGLTVAEANRCEV